MTTDTVDAFLDRVRKAWDDGDARTYGEQFTEDASYVIFLGDAMFGRAEIERSHHDVFTKWQRGTRMVVTPIKVNQVDDDSAVVVTVGGIGTGEKIAYDKFQTYTLRRAETGQWQCAAFQNTEMSQRAREIYA
ncbi:SgcJ/EcaC family oxidoreductase [Amycolatopsis sp. CA-230715]|uniref:SgcJ/EcaC family oxidoreductase n=1 Tax=Amycolatopsis sp. CA-230715 TaxID=2745196 RepID=UPI001C038CC4|nr:SgcJ/EcaC family oxidoreductase [Amycolatopsis sp. CA-230715]QWF81762.1 hypothetical protein HUW46_05195 [Amycolatopsis sp. CA-230715]